ncbi:MAG: hypothetical protein DRQ13_00565 [Ignavibacteriae bacterium]|nr:MAG: hypothetical protein DRQ13_00565 [Ignavibacteriota bacterium]
MRKKIMFSVSILLVALSLNLGFETVAQTQRNPVLEEFTGTWCPWCPCGHTTMAQILQTIPNAIMIGYHGPANGSDPYSFFPGNGVIGMLSPPFWPSATIDRTGAPDSRDFWTGQMTARNNVPATVGITLQRTYNPTTRELNAAVNVTALENLTGNYSMTLILLEDGLINSQAGNGSCPGGSNYVHNHVVRSMINGATGEDLNGGNPWNTGETITKNIQNILPSEVIPDNCRLVVLVHKTQTPLYNAEIQQAIQLQLLDPNYTATMTTTDGYYFGESSNTAIYTAYIKNTGLLADTYNISLDFDGPGGWTNTFTTVNGTFNLGETDTVTVNPGDSISVQISVNANSINGYGKTDAKFYSLNGSYGIVKFKFTTFGLEILVVDDDGGMNYEEYIVDELNTLGSEYGVIPSDFIPSNTGILNTFNTFVWNTAITEPGISADEMNSLKIFLDNGGNLYLNGVDLAYQMADPTSPFYSTETNNFFTDYLHSSYILREHTATIAVGIDSDPITDSLAMMRLVGGTGANTINPSEGHYVNQIEAGDASAANILSLWLKPDEYSAIRTVHGSTGKVVLTAFGFETIALDEIRALFAERLINWLSIPVGVEQTDPTMMPVSFNLSQNFPNPFNPSTIIKYAVPEESPVSIKVFDLTGREVVTLVNEVKQPGTYELTFDAKKYASGVYIYQMISGDFVQVKKMSLLK